MAIKVGMVSLGCPKNQIDAELLLAMIQDDGFELVGDVAMADIAVINTCGFIESAKQESIDEILELSLLKKEGRIKHMIVTGCLAERYRDEILSEIPEVDAVVGIGANRKITKVLRQVLAGKQQFLAAGPKEELPVDGKRVLTTLPYYAYLKIAEGCDNCCSYCAIPSIRGRFRSRDMEHILKEAESLAQDGVKELVVVAQDTSRYGEDLCGTSMLPKLLEELCKIDGFVWIRLLYCYPERITDELLDVIASQPKIANYIDIPIQHCDAQILRRMNRRGDEQWLLELVEKIRAKVPGIAVRTTLIAGFPGETLEQFESLVGFVKQARFDRLGCFAYSAEEGTPAASMDGQLEQEEKERRAELVMLEQMRIHDEKNQARIGSTMKVVVEGYDRLGEVYFGRSEYDAPDIDGKIFFTCSKKPTMGDFLDVLIEDVMDYDLIGSAVEQ